MEPSKLLQLRRKSLRSKKSKESLRSKEKRDNTGVQELVPMEESSGPDVGVENIQKEGKNSVTD